jgi:DNA-binding transcriptional LysR family regulator
MDRLQAMSAFVRVVEHGSFARAAERLDLSTSAVSRHVAELEAHLGARLLNRTTRRLSLTESGQSFYERCVQLLADLEEAEAAASASTAQPHGTIRVSCAANFALLHMAPAIGAFLDRYPKIRLDISLSDRLVDLVEEGYDLAIRIGNLGESNLVARKLGVTRLMVVGAPAYLKKHGRPRVPEDLAAHNCFTYEYLRVRGQWPFVDEQGRERWVRVGGSLHSNNGELLARAAVKGIGLAYEPDFIVGADVRAGRLIPVLTEHTRREAGIYAVYPSRRHLSAKVRVFVDFLAERFRDAGDWSGVAAA